MIKPLFFSSLLASLAIASCSTILNNLPGVYTLDIQQGNIIDQSMVDQLRPNMNKRQVLYIMGSPMLVDVFHPERWDYLYSLQPGGEPRLQKRVSLFFNEDSIIAVQGDFKPSTVPIIKASEEKTVDVPKRNIDKTLWETITGLLGLDNVDNASETDRTEKKPSANEPQF
ncbi:Outer membrane protein assembly factor BamE [Candidatus Methylobacter favarea]|uniref:Outer membrane protein assembly factor BamE n=1 Tax=Candidatus Methylobacter favarea TaxID=2707345 RepID=A0A8S0Y5U8_9GAMM|nr:outer membrane protein assembly factor BamE [Candidatus Methylobacter favarea]CAA9889838.1 Outer membrane protein assembly factor BamE [Candidatus Methylobacter favarea]